jgi:hypothetical protein
MGAGEGAAKYLPTPLDFEKMKKRMKYTKY